VIITFIVTQGLLYAVIVNSYLFLMMITLSPRVWGYTDYPQVVKDKVAPPTKKEKTIAIIVGIPWFVFVLGFPIFSAYNLKMTLGNQHSFMIAFIHLITLMLLTSIIDAVVLDWLIISRITPKFVIIPGTAPEDYKDFSYHFQGHLKASVIMVIISIILAFVMRLI
jgi:hypothetical protein